MSDINTTKFLLDLEEENLILDESRAARLTKLASGITAKEVFFKTTTPFVICPQCGQLVHRLHDYRTVRMKHFPCGKQPLLVSIKKKRFRCLCCKINITEQIDALEKHCFISIATKQSIVASLMQIGSLKGICQELNVSYSTVYRALDKVPNPKPAKSLPPVLSFDEFKANTTEGKYAFMVVDPIDKKILEILPDRKFNHVFRFFTQYPKKVRKRVKFIISHLWKPYQKIIKLLFPNAVMVADKFHYQRVISNALMAVRKRIGKDLDATNAYHLKKHWRLLHKRFSTVDHSQWRYSRWLKCSITDYQLVGRLLELDPTLKEAYDLYQTFLLILDLGHETQQVKHLDKWIISARKLEIPEFHAAAKTMTSWYSEICASFIRYNGQTLSNGFIEGLNNKIKVIKRVSFGYRSFLNFRKRILLTFYFDH